VAPMTDGGPPVEVERSVPSLAARISTSMVQLMSQYTGRGPTRARTTMSRDLVVVVFEHALTKAERNLVSAGQGEAVVNQRRLFQRVMREAAVAAVEELTGRRVRSFMSDLDADQDVAAALFVLEDGVDADTDGASPAEPPSAAA
jgi:uncharacterized protein YbcI